jgi:hypothetical protein
MSISMLLERNEKKEAEPTGLGRWFRLADDWLGGGPLQVCRKPLMRFRDVG